LPAYTPPARRIALLDPIKHPKTLIILLFIGTAHFFQQEVHAMPGQAERQARNKKRERLRELRAAEEVIAAKKLKLAALKAEFPEARDRCKLALSIPDPRYPELDGASVKQVTAFFDVSESMYFAAKKDLKARVDVAVAAELLNRKVVAGMASRDRASSAALSVLDRGDTDELREEMRKRLLEELPPSEDVGRPKMFWKQTLDAALAEFHRRVVSIKRGMADDALSEMLIRLRQKFQARPGQRLQEPSETCIRDAIKEMGITDGVLGGTATTDRAAAIEEYRNSIGCAATFTALQKMGISPALLFNVDEVGIYLDERTKKVRILRFPRGMVEEAKKRKLSPAEQRRKTQPRMIYLECMTSAEGALVAVVVRLVENKMKADKLILQLAESNVYVAFVNSSYDKAKYHATMMCRVWLPKIRECQRQETVRSRQDSSLVLPEFDSPYYCLAEHQPNYAVQGGELTLRALLSFDGAYEHIEAIMKGTMANYCQQHNIGLFKWAAGCSLVQQPNDVSKCHKILHAYFRKSSFRFFEDDGVRLRSGYANAMRVLQAHKATTQSKQTFKRFFAHLPQCLSVAFTPDAISKGYEVCGVYPFDVNKIMNGWNPGSKNPKSCWQMLSDEEQQYILIAIEKLSLVAEQEGTVTDEQIDECVVGPGLTVGLFVVCYWKAYVCQVEAVLSDARCPEYLRLQITPGKGVNRRGCILMTNKNWLRKEKAARAQLMSDPKEPKQIYGKNFDISNCKCHCRSKDLTYHSKDSKHNAHVKAIEERLRQGETLDARDDDAVKLALAYIAANPVARTGVHDLLDDDEDDFGLAGHMNVAAGADADGGDLEAEEMEEEAEVDESDEEPFEENEFMQF
jgi:hypothetical protein